MSDAAPAPTPAPQPKRLDMLLKNGGVKMGDRFLYQVNGAGKVFEGTLKEQSPSGFVNLNDSNCWDMPAQLFVVEILTTNGTVIPLPIAAAVQADKKANPEPAPVPEPPLADNEVRPPKSLFGHILHRLAFVLPGKTHKPKRTTQ